MQTILNICTRMSSSKSEKHVDPTPAIVIEIPISVAKRFGGGLRWFSVSTAAGFLPWNTLCGGGKTARGYLQSAGSAGSISPTRRRPLGFSEQSSPPQACSFNPLKLEETAGLAMKNKVRFKGDRIPYEDNWADSDGRSNATQEY